MKKMFGAENVMPPEMMRHDGFMRAPLSACTQLGHPQYASLCIELDVASCGRTKTEAIEGLKRAIAAYIAYMTSENRKNEIARPVPMDELKAFLFTEDTQHEQSFKAREYADPHEEN